MYGELEGLTPTEIEARLEKCLREDLCFIDLRPVIKVPDANASKVKLFKWDKNSRGVRIERYDVGQDLTYEVPVAAQYVDENANLVFDDKGIIVGKLLKGKKGFDFIEKAA